MTTEQSVLDQPLHSEEIMPPSFSVSIANIIDLRLEANTAVTANSSAINSFSLTNTSEPLTISSAVLSRLQKVSSILVQIAGSHAAITDQLDTIDLSTDKDTHDDAPTSYSPGHGNLPIDRVSLQAFLRKIMMPSR